MRSVRNLSSVLALVCACGVAAVASAQTQQEIKEDQHKEFRPVNPRENPPSLTERAKGAEASLPVVVQRSIDGDAELKRENVKVAGNESRRITLSGTVSSQRLKDRAQQLAQNVSGVQHVHNDLVVRGTADEVNGGTDAATTDHSDPEHRMPQRE